MGFYEKAEQAKLFVNERASPTLPEPKRTKQVVASSAIFLLVVAIVLLLMSTVFKIKDPIIQMSLIRIQNITVLNGQGPSFNRHLVNMTIVAELSIENRNVVSFKFNEATTNLNYETEIVGKAITPKGEAPPGEAVLTSVPVINVNVDQMKHLLRFDSDIALAVVPFSTDTRVGGQVTIASTMKKSFVANIHCEFKVDLKQGAAQYITCSTKLSS